MAELPTAVLEAINDDDIELDLLDGYIFSSWSYNIYLRVFHFTRIFFVSRGLLDRGAL
jgi:hypothetical protein